MRTARCLCLQRPLVLSALRRLQLRYSILQPSLYLLVVRAYHHAVQRTSYRRTTRCAEYQQIAITPECLHNSPPMLQMTRCLHQDHELEEGIHVSGNGQAACCIARIHRVTVQMCLTFISSTTAATTPKNARPRQCPRSTQRRPVNFARTTTTLPNIRGFPVDLI